MKSATTPPCAIYTGLGYQPVCNLHETPLLRKEPVGVVSFARRAVAGWRGRHEHGKEIVVPMTRNRRSRMHRTSYRATRDPPACHHENPELGHDGLGKLLAAEGIARRSRTS